MANKKILITGGAGFIAKNLYEYLNNDYNISAPDIEELNLLDSKKVFNYIKKSHFDAIIHTATHPAAKDPNKVLESNLKMFFNIANSSDFFGKMIYFGSGAEFGRENWRAKMGEDFFGKNIPQDQYGFSKYIMTECVKFHKNIYNLRLFGVFGKYDNWRTRFIPSACSYAIAGLAIRMDENKAYDFLSTDDIALIVKWFIDNKPKKNIYNVCTGKIRSFKSIAEKIIEISGKNLGIIIKNNASHIKYGGDNSILLKEMGGFKFNPFEKKLEELYNWYNANKSIIKKEELYGYTKSN